jgi:predicted enzyme related to lactoylglutathione lyase/pimeloyl-ACP methyl ester carboxylesterase
MSFAPDGVSTRMSKIGATYVLVPGAGGDSWYWSRVARRLRARGHEVLSPDLPAADDAAGLGEYADTVVRAIGDRSGAIVVAQSMGAFPASMACERADVGLLVLVAPMIPAPAESPGEWWSATGQTLARRRNEEHAGRDPDAEFDVITGFFHDVPPEVVAEAFARGEPRQSDTPFAEPWPLDAWPDVPTRVLVGRHDRLFPPEFLVALARERLGIEADVIDSGHLPALSRPDELTDWLETYRAASGRSPGERPSSKGTSMGQPVVHFEITGSDPERLRSYYGDLFGWEFDTSPPVSPAVSEAGNYGFVNPTDGGIPGGVGGGAGYEGHVMFYVGVPDVEAALQQAESLGGTRRMGPERAPGGSLVVGHFTDPQGHLIGVAGTA